MSDSEVVGYAWILGCKAASLPFKYLGVPVRANMGLKRNWQPIIERVQNRLSSWKAKNLSFGGRLTLVKSVLGSLPIYFFSFFKAPTSIIEHLERLRIRFLWGGSEEKNKVNWVVWKVVLVPKDMGGLEVGSLMSLNLALLIKWIWRYKTDSTCLWRQVICRIHNLSGKRFLV